MYARSIRTARYHSNEGMDEKVSADPMARIRFVSSRRYEGVRRVADGELARGTMVGEDERVERRELTAVVVGAAEGGRRAETS
jgi:hypothetical protein